MDEATCPVCNERVQGSVEELNSHVEMCLRKVSRPTVLLFVTIWHRVVESGDPTRCFFLDVLCALCKEKIESRLKSAWCLCAALFEL